MKKIIYICVLLFCISCVNSNNNQNIEAVKRKYGEIDSVVYNNSKVISVLNRDKALNIELNQSLKNNPIKGWSYIVLDDAESPIGEINKIAVYDSLLFAISVHNSKSLVSFNIETGTYIAKYGNVGRSNSEYIEPTDFIVRNDSVIVLDNRSKKLLYYDLSGKYLKSQRLKFALKTIINKPNSSNIYGISGENQHIESIKDALVLEIDHNGNIVSQHLDRPMRLNFSSLGTIRNINDNIVVYERFASQYISIMENEDILAYNIDFGDSALPKNYLQKCNGNFIEFSDNYKNIYSYVNSFFETDNYLFISYTNKGRYGNLGIYDKQQEKIIYNHLPTFRSDKPNANELLLMDIISSPACYLNGGCAIKINDASASVLANNGFIEDTMGKHVVFKVQLLENTETYDK